MTTRKVFSFEFFPPQTPEGMAKLRTTREQLAQLKPEFFSVTYGAGGTTRERTLACVREILAAGSAAAPHLSCIGSTRANISAILDRYKADGVRHLVALRGDLPAGETDPGEFRYANELVAFIRECTGDSFYIEVAAYPEYHPESHSPDQDMDAFRRKVDAGADSAITQYFYNADAYWHFVDQAQATGVTIPIVPGIMPITSYARLVRFSDACGAEIPRWIRLKLQGYGDDLASIRAFGLDVITSLCADLLERGAPGLHFYTLNQAGPTTILWQRLGLG